MTVMNLFLLLPLDRADWMPEGRGAVQLPFRKDILAHDDEFAANVAADNRHPKRV